MSLLKKLTVPALLVLALTLMPMASELIFGIPIGAGQVTFDSGEVIPAGNLDAFVPTGSDSSICLVTLSESNAFFVGPSSAICVPRTFQGQKGVRIIVIPYFATFPSDLTLSVTVYQRGARRYGQPVLYTGP